jgi:hypothetical protein
MTRNERYLTLIIKSEMRAFWSSFKSSKFWCSSRASIKKTNKLSVSERESSNTSSFTLSLLIFLVFARRRTSKISTFERASKSSHFRLDNQRQTSLVSNHTCRNRKRLISSINLQNFYVAVLQAHCEYSEYVRAKLLATFLSDLTSECQCIRRMMSTYSKNDVKISTNDVSLSLLKK